MFPLIWIMQPFHAFFTAASFQLFVKWWKENICKSGFTYILKAINTKNLIRDVKRDSNQSEYSIEYPSYQQFW